MEEDELGGRREGTEMRLGAVEEEEEELEKEERVRATPEPRALLALVESTVVLCSMTVSDCTSFARGGRVGDDDDNDDDEEKEEEEEEKATLSPASRLWLWL